MMVSRRTLMSILLVCLGRIRLIQEVRNMVCYLMRHGKDDETVRGGWSDAPLTDIGTEQAKVAAEGISRKQCRINRILSSDLPRAVQTARCVAEKLGLPMELRPEFREVNNGVLAGMKNELALVRYPGLFWNQLDWEERYPGGESPKEFVDRVASGWERLRNEIMASGENALLVTHGGVIHVIMSLEKGEVYSNRNKHPKIDYCQIVEMEIGGK